jgi:hypothetical protein
MLFVENVGIRWLRLEAHITHMTHVVSSMFYNKKRCLQDVQFMTGCLSLLRNERTYGFRIGYHVFTTWLGGVCDEALIYTCYKIL